jgi:hypothetical protein
VKEKHRDGVRNMASSPRKKTKTESARKRCGARDGGRLRLRLERGILGTTSVLCFGVRWSGGMRELGINSPRVLQVRKEGLGGKDSVGGTGERNRTRRGEEEGVVRHAGPRRQ